MKKLLLFLAFLLLPIEAKPAHIVSEFNRTIVSGITAAGTTQGTATVLTGYYNLVSTAAAGTGVQLPAYASTAASLGDPVFIVNNGANVLAVYPQTGGSIGNLATNAAYSLGPGSTLQVIALTTTTSVSSVLNPNFSDTVLFHTGLAFINAPTGTMANNGALTLGTALPSINAHAYINLPASAISSGSAAGWYYATCSSTTVCTVFNNTYASGQPTIPASPTSFSTTGPGSYTGVTGATDSVIYSLPGGTMGIRDGIRVTSKWSVLQNTDSKTLKVTYGGSTVFSFALNSSTQHNYTCEVTLSNREVTNAQIGAAVNATGCQTTVNGEFNRIAIDSTAAQNVSENFTMATATDYLILEEVTIELLKGQ